MWGVRGRALSQPRLPALWAGLPGPTSHWLWARGAAGVGTRHQPHSARSCELALRAVGAARGRPGGAPAAWCGASGVGRSPTPDYPPYGGAAGAHYPLAVGVGGCGRGDPSRTPQRALLRAGFARCGGGTRVPRGGASCLGVGRPGSGALPPPTARPLCGLPGPTTHWLWVWGDAGVRTRHQPQSALALRAVGAACGCPGGAPLAWVWGVRGRALYLPRMPALLAGCGGPLPTGCGCGGLRAWGPVTNPTARTLACRGGGMWLPGGGASCLGAGRRGSGALPPPTARPLGGLPGPTTHWLWVRGVAGVGTRHQPHSAHSCELALRAVGTARGCPGGAPLALVWGVRGRALSHPRLTALWAGLPGPTNHWLWVWGGCGRGDPSPTPQRAGFARCGGGMRAPGEASCLGVGRLGSGALPPPTARPLGGLPGPTTHWLWVRGGAGVGTRHQPHSARSCELALRAVGGA